MLTGVGLVLRVISMESLCGDSDGEMGRGFTQEGINVHREGVTLRSEGGYKTIERVKV